jgi:translation initiation factor 4G
VCKYYLTEIYAILSARDVNEVAQCIRDLNSPAFHPSMVSVWVMDSYERKDTERDLLAKLLVKLGKSQDGLLSQTQLNEG